MEKLSCLTSLSGVSLGSGTSPLMPCHVYTISMPLELCECLLNISSTIHCEQTNLGNLICCRCCPLGPSSGWPGIWLKYLSGESVGCVLYGLYALLLVCHLQASRRLTSAHCLAQGCYVKRSLLLLLRSQLLLLLMTLLRQPLTVSNSLLLSTY